MPSLLVPARLRSVRHLMRYLREREIVPLFMLLLLGGCGVAARDCASSETREAVIKTISGDSNNALVQYAAKKSDAVKTKVDAARTEADKSAIVAHATQSAVYRLSDTIRTNGKSRDKRTVSCSAVLYATVEGAIAQKQVDFKVERGPDGTLSASVMPFQFDPSKD